ncbi:pyruvate dehydrogenase [acetyl-transferring]-phosphatase 1, mitochondrial-like isoform X2 [Myripristis murdjan]|uniref:pyruvate dehydrogenase [acetyl-transferring]-phosphatase 1, mitochondrial-like isoform X2 n=1 Tax=Myripristis murdjan TaxID=586833 RepID=UPI001175FAD3|nr:pyruvate dehydrogenase [acetyl-transferring]-phosphatase 1, mitochondrial-like isoform X2 [Myripristis murdjan]
MLARSVAATQGAGRVDAQLCHSLCSLRPELPRLHYPAGRGSRKYRAGQEAGQMGVAQINRILKANEYSHTLPRGPASHGVLGFHSNLLPSNHPSEDRRSGATCLPGGGLLLGVFDGHAGPACAHAVSQRLFYYIAVATLPLRTLAELEQAVQEERAVPPLLEWHKHPQDHSGSHSGQDAFHSLRAYWQLRLQGQDGGSISSALVDAFSRLDDDLSLEAQAHLRMSPPRRGSLPGRSLTCPLQVALSGCTACVVHVSQGVLHVANLGDSRAVLGVQEAGGGWSALSLTADHNAQNPAELRRVAGEHPAAERRTAVRHGRLLGLLLPFRAFGDVRFKWSSEALAHLCETRPDVLAAVGGVRAPQNYLTPPYLSARPEVTCHRIRAADKFLVLATDGLWELMHRQTVVQLVGQQLAASHSSQSQQTSSAVTMTTLMGAPGQPVSSQPSSSGGLGSAAPV